MIGKVTDAILWERAKDYLAQYQPHVIGVAGGFDKTLTREALRLVLQEKYSVRAIDTDTPSIRDMAQAILGSTPTHKKPWWNILIGSRIQEIKTPEPDTIILEAALMYPGDIDRLAKEISFSTAVMLNVPSTHLDVFGDTSQVAHELLSLPVTIPAQGVTILNLDDPLIAGMRQHISSHMVTFGKDPEADVRLIRSDRIGLSGFVGEVEVAKKRYEFSVPHLVGHHQLQSVLAALAVAYAHKITIASALKALRSVHIPSHHLEIRDGLHTSLIIDDTHDASFESMMASSRTLSAMPGYLPHTKRGDVRKIAILGDVVGLGAHTKSAHTAIGQAVWEAADMFVAVGEEMKTAQAKVLQLGKRNTHHFHDSRDVGKWIAGYIRPSDIVLIKGSRSMNMEKVVEVLTKN